MTFLLPALFAILVWWASTGFVLVALRFAERAPRAVLFGSAFVFAGSVAALAASAADTSPAGAYLAFMAAIGIWGVQELAFLAGWITGPWRAPAPAAAGALTKAGYATAAILYHELALLGTGALVAAATLGGDNQLGPWTFGALFAMRISAKLNVFLGVANLTESFLPAHLAYLKSYFGEKPINLLFPVSVGALTIALAQIVVRAVEADEGAAAALSLLGTLVALGLLEHWLLVLPLPVERLWAWSLEERSAARAKPSCQIIELDTLRMAAVARAADGEVGRGAP